MAEYVISDISGILPNDSAPWQVTRDGACVARTPTAEQATEWVAKAKNDEEWLASHPGLHPWESDAASVVSSNIPNSVWTQIEIDDVTIGIFQETGSPVLITLKAEISGHCSCCDYY